MIVGPCAAFSLLVVVVAPWIGSTGVTWHHVLAGISPDREIFVVARLPRTLFAAIVGGALAVAGVLFQALLRNSLADPFTLGVSAFHRANRQHITGIHLASGRHYAEFCIRRPDHVHSLRGEFQSGLSYDAVDHGRSGYR